MAALLGCGFDDPRQRERARRFRAAATVVAVAATAVIAFGGVFLYQQGQIHQRQADLSLSQARGAAARADRLLAGGDRMGAIRTALSTLDDTGDGQRCYEAQASLERATQAYPTEHNWLPLYRIESEATIEALATSKMAGTLATIDSSGVFTVRQLESGNPVRCVPLTGQGQDGLGIDGDWLSWELECCGDGYLAFARGEQALGFYDATGGKLLWRYDAPEGVSSVSMSADGSKACATGIDLGDAATWVGTLHMIDVSTGTLLWHTTTPVGDVSKPRSAIGGRNDSVCATFGDTLVLTDSDGTVTATASLSMPSAYDISWTDDTVLVVEVAEAEAGIPCRIEAFDGQLGKRLWSEDVKYPTWAVNGRAFSPSAEFYGTARTTGGPRTICGLGGKLLLVSADEGSMETLDVYESPICTVDTVEGRAGSWLRICTVYDGVSELATEGQVLGEERSDIAMDPPSMARFTRLSGHDFLVTAPFDDSMGHHAICAYRLGIPLEDRFVQPSEDSFSFDAGSSITPTDGELSSVGEALGRAGLNEPYEVVVVSEGHAAAVVQLQDSFACVRLSDGRVTQTTEGSFGRVKNAGFAKDDTLFFARCTTSDQLDNERLYVFDLDGDYLAAQSAIAFGEAILADGRSVLVRTESTSYVLPYLSPDEVVELGREILGNAEDIG